MHFIKTQHDVCLKLPGRLRSAFVRSVCDSSTSSFFIYNITIRSVPSGQIEVLQISLMASTNLQMLQNVILPTNFLSIESKLMII